MWLKSREVVVALLFQVSPLDSMTFLTAPVLLGLAGALPCALTARQARTIDPAICLRID
jgi:hypothetical protein